MPIYEYGCQACGHTFDRLQKISADPVSDCPECAVEGEVKKLVSRSSFVLKGGGWYKDHYGLKSGGSDSSDGDSSASDSSDSKSSASDSSASDSSASKSSATDSSASDSSASKSSAGDSSD
jgi:putative FmdB family regulatory protein